MNPVLKAPGYRRGWIEDDQRNVCNGGLGRGDKRDRGQRQRVDVRNCANGGHGRKHKGSKGLQGVRLDRLAVYSKDQVMASGTDGVSEMSEGVYEEACRLCCKRASIRWYEMTGDSQFDRVGRVMAQLQKAKESDDGFGSVLGGPSPLELQRVAAIALNSRPTAGSSSS